MLLAHLLPFLDAEIDRLQHARDLLAYVPSPLLLQATEARISVAAIQQAPDTTVAGPPATVEQGPQVVVLKPHGLNRGWRHTRRRVAPLADTALRSSVPAGPVVVSAEEVRRAQAGKPSTATRPAVDIPPSFSWQSPSHESRDMGALLQKLMDLGKQDDSAQPATARA